MRTRALLSAGVASLFLLAACSTTDSGPKQTGGTLIGAAGGALAGSQFGDGKGRLAAVAAGTLIGAFIGNEVGKSLDKADEAHARQAERAAHNAPIGRTIQWQNPDSGHSGTVTPVRAGTDTQSGAYCREYQTDMVKNGATGKSGACMIATAASATASLVCGDHERRLRL